MATDVTTTGGTTGQYFQPMTGTAGTAGTTDPRVQEFLNSQAYRDFQQSQVGAMNTMDMYNSPYFGSIGSGSAGRAQDTAYEQWLSQNYNTQGGTANAGTTDTTVTGDTAGATGGTARVLDPSQSTLSPNFDSYVYDMLAKGQAAANLPFQNFTGQRFAFGAVNPATGMYEAGYSPLEKRGLDLMKDLGQYGPGAFKGGLGEIGDVASFMSPYQQAVTDIELRKAREAGELAKRDLAAKFTTQGGAGAFGGSRYAIESGLADRSLQDRLSDIQAKGLQTAYDKATDERRYATEQGMQGLGQVMEGGQLERRLAQEPLDFGYSEWLKSVDRPKQQAREMQDLLAGLPLQATAYQPEQSAIVAALQGLLAASGLAKVIGG
jgi:hypothetical protein